MTEDEKAELAEVYERAAEHIENHGWFGTGSKDKFGSACFVLAITRTNETIPHHAFEFAANALEVEPFMGSYFSGMVAWNDNPHRTKDEVINTLHALANKLR